MWVYVSISRLPRFVDSYILKQELRGVLSILPAECYRISTFPILIIVFVFLTRRRSIETVSFPVYATSEAIAENINHCLLVTQREELNRILNYF